VPFGHVCSAEPISQIDFREVDSLVQALAPRFAEPFLNWQNTLFDVRRFSLILRLKNLVSHGDESGSTGADT
jgi:hypothetical protein